MCGRCEGEPYRAVGALFNGDLQAQMEYIDRGDWLVLSGEVTVYLGDSDLPKEEYPLFRGCPTAIEGLEQDVRAALDGLSAQLGRPAVGRP